MGIQKVFGSNLSQNTVYPGVFNGFPAPSGKCQDSTLNSAMTASFYILSSSLFTTIQSFDPIQSDLLTASLNKL
jgi:hypothetical protein